MDFCSTHLPSRGLFFYLARTPHSTDSLSLSISPPAFRHRSLKGFALVAFIARDSIKHRWAETKENEEVKEGERETESEGREQLQGRGNNNGEKRGMDGRRSVKRSRQGRAMPEEQMKCRLY